MPHRPREKGGAREGSSTAGRENEAKADDRMTKGVRISSGQDGRGAEDKGEGRAETGELALQGQGKGKLAVAAKDGESSMSKREERKSLHRKKSKNKERGKEEGKDVCEDRQDTSEVQGDLSSQQGGKERKSSHRKKNKNEERRKGKKKGFCEDGPDTFEAQGDVSWKEARTTRDAEWESILMVKKRDCKHETKDVHKEQKEGEQSDMEDECEGMLPSLAHVHETQQHSGMWRKNDIFTAKGILIPKIMHPKLTGARSGTLSSEDIMAVFTPKNILVRLSPLPYLQ